jgi:glycerol-3-phosphate acyltransferase PlsY
MLALLLIVAYLLGAIPFAVVVGRALRGVDVRHAGTGNTGALNTLRTAGPAAGALVAALDAAKGALAVWAGTWLLGREAGALAGCVAVIGHCFSPYLIAASPRIFQDGWKRALRRTGGKGLATGVGVLIAVAWPIALVGAIVFGLVYAVQRKDVTWPSVFGTLSATPAAWYLTENLLLTMAMFVVGLVITIKHLPDLREGFYVAQQE